MNSMRKAVLWVLLGLLITPAWADTTSLPLTDDAWINANNPGANFGLEPDIFVHSWGPKEGLVRFDAATISGQTVTSATLELYLGSIATSGEISIHAITSSWNETTVTWNNRPPAEAVATAIVSLATGDAGGTVTIDVTAAVQRWADGSLADAGFLIVTSDSIKAYFDAKEQAGGAPATLTVERGSAPSTGELPVVLDLSNVPVVIDEPGHYVLDRDWKIKGSLINVYKIIDIQASDVTLDFQGFSIEMLSDGDVVVISGDSVVLRNGTIRNQWDGVGVKSSGNGTVLERMFIWTEVVARLGSRAVARNNRFLARFGLDVGSDSSVEFNNFVCAFECLSASGDNIRVTDNTLNGLEYVVSLVGSDNIVARNTIALGDSSGAFGTLLVDGDRNTIEANVSKGYFYNSNRLAAIVIDGSANVVRSNLALPAWNDLHARWYIGIEFLQGGNYYGNNQMAAIEPFVLNGTVQIDWGGNTGF